MKTVELQGKLVEVAATVDAVGLFCPMPIVRLKLEADQRRSGEIVELLADDPGVEADVPAWCTETRNSLLSLEQDAEGIFTAYIEILGT